MDITVSLDEIIDNLQLLRGVVTEDTAKKTIRSIERALADLWDVIDWIEFETGVDG